MHLARRHLLAGFALASALGAAGAQPPAFDKSFPTKPVTFVVPFAAGGLTDQVLRILAQQLSEQWGQTAVVENKPGANGGVAAAAVKQAKADGFTLMVASAGTHSINQAIYPRLSYDPIKDFEPVTLLYRSTHFVLVPNSSPAKNLKELVDMLRAKPGLLYATSGSGSGAHLAGELFKTQAKVELTHVPYKGSAAAIPDAIAGRVDILIDGTTSAPLVREGKLRALAVTDSLRSPALPDVPTAAEAGVPGVVMNSWFGIIAPAGTPAGVINKLAVDIDKAMKSQAVQTKTSTMGITVATGTPREFGFMIASETVRMAKLVKATGARAD